MTRSPKDFPTANNLRLPDSPEHNANTSLSGNPSGDQPWVMLRYCQIDRGRHEQSSAAKS